MIGTREIDPSLPPVQYRTLLGLGVGDSGGWPSSPAQSPQWITPPLDFTRYRGDIKKLLEDRQSEPDVSSFASLVTSDGSKWVVLHGFEEQREHLDDWTVASLGQRTWIRSVLLDKNSGRAGPGLLKKIWRANIHETRIELLRHVDCCYAGEIGWSKRICVKRPEEPESFSLGKQIVLGTEMCEGYVWEGNILDGSLSDSVQAVMPSRFVQSRSMPNLIMAGPTWVNLKGDAIACYQDFGQVRGNALFARAEWLTEFLKETCMILVILAQFERMLSDPNRSGVHPRLTVWSTAKIDENSSFRLVGKPLRREELW
jgi:hypothetical protein